MSTNLTIVRGDSASIGFVVYESGTTPFNLTGRAVEFVATNGTQSITKTLAGGGITVAVSSPATGAGFVTINPADTSGWPDVTDPLDWYLRVTAGTEVYTVGDGTLSVVLTLSPPAPAVSDVSAAEGPSEGGTVVTISGTGFTGATAVTFGGIPATAFSVDAATTITATVPAHVAGAVAVSVTTPNGTSTVLGAFTYFDPVEITSVSPIEGSTAAGQTLVLTGKGLTGATSLTFGGTAATSFAVNSPTSISAVVPAHAAGQVDVVVTTPRGTFTLAGGYTFVEAFAPVPTVASVSPAECLTTGGEFVTVSGTGFTGATLVTFGGVAASSFTVNSSISISAVVPAHVAALVDVVVTGPAGEATLVGGYTFVAPVPPEPLPSPGAAYCTAADVRSALAGNPRLTAGLTGKAPTETPDDAVISHAAYRGARLMDRYFLGRADTPITGPAALLETLRETNVTIAIWKLLQEQLIAESYRGFEDDKNDAVKWLEKIQAGKGSLLSASAPTAPIVDSGFGGSAPQVFGADSAGNVVIF